MHMVYRNYNGKEIIEKVVSFMNDIRKEYAPNITDDMLCDEGDGEKIYYANGNDSTYFDWHCNNRLCEFYMYYKESEMGFIKLLIRKDGSVTAYVYEENYQYGDKPISVSKTIFYSSEALYFAALMDKIADKKLNWNNPISYLDFDTEITELEIEEFDEEDNEDDDEDWY